MTGGEAQAFTQRTRSESEDFVRCEMTAIECFESRLQQKYECRIRDVSPTTFSLCRMNAEITLAVRR